MARAPQGPSLAPADEILVRDPLANRAAVLAARERPMAERLALAVSWNRVASELRGALHGALTRHEVTRPSSDPRRADDRPAGACTSLRSLDDQA